MVQKPQLEKWKIAKNGKISSQMGESGRYNMEPNSV